MADASTIHLPPPGTGPALATILGLLCGVGLISIAIYPGGSPVSFLTISSILILIGGTLAVTTICYSVTEVRKTIRTTGKPPQVGKFAQQHFAPDGAEAVF